MMKLKTAITALLMTTVLGYAYGEGMSRLDVIAAFSDVAKTSLSQGEAQVAYDQLIETTERKFCMEEKGCLIPFTERITVNVAQMRQRLTRYDAAFALANAHAAAVVALLKDHEAAGGYLPPVINVAYLENVNAKLRKNYDEIGVLDAIRDSKKSAAGLVDVAVGSKNFLGYRSGSSIRNLIDSSSMRSLKAALNFLADPNLAVKLQKIKKAEEARRRAAAEAERFSRKPFLPYAKEFF